MYDHFVSTLGLQVSRFQKMRSIMTNRKLREIAQEQRTEPAAERVLVRRGMGAEAASDHLSPLLGCLLEGYPDFVD